MAADCPDAGHATIDRPQSGMHQHFRHDQVFVSGALENARLRRSFSGESRCYRDVELTNPFLRNVDGGMSV